MHPDGFEIKYTDFYFEDDDRTIRVALCPILSLPYSDEELEYTICSKCPVHIRRKTDLFCICNEEIYRKMRKTLSGIHSYLAAYKKVVKILVGTQRASG